MSENSFRQNFVKTNGVSVSDPLIKDRIMSFVEVDEEGEQSKRPQTDRQTLYPPPPPPPFVPEKDKVTFQREPGSSSSHHLGASLIIIFLSQMLWSFTPIF